MPFVGTNVDKIFLLYSYYYRNNCALSLLPACLCDHIRNDQSNAPTFQVENREGNQHVLSESDVSWMHQEPSVRLVWVRAVVRICGCQAAWLGLLCSWTQEDSDKGHISFISFSTQTVL